jgi:hypothetical protein
MRRKDLGVTGTREAEREGKREQGAQRDFSMWRPELQAGIPLPIDNCFG